MNKNAFNCLLMNKQTNAFFSFFEPMVSRHHQTTVSIPPEPRLEKGIEDVTIGRISFCIPKYTRTIILYARQLAIL